MTQSKMLLTTIALYSTLSAEVLALDISLEDVEAGVSAAAARMSHHMDEFDAANYDYKSSILQIGDAFSKYESETDWSPRAVELAAEIVAIGIHARDTYDEEPISPEEIHNFFISYEDIINSWKHEHAR